MTDIYTEAIAVLGPESRYTKLAEEAAELSVAAHHFRDGKIQVESLADEVAGVEMLCRQMRLMLGDKVIDHATTKQLVKLRSAIREARHD